MTPSPGSHTSPARTPAKQELAEEIVPVPPTETPLGPVKPKSTGVGVPGPTKVKEIDPCVKLKVGIGLANVNVQNRIVGTKPNHSLRIKWPPGTWGSVAKAPDESASMARTWMKTFADCVVLSRSVPHNSALRKRQRITAVVLSAGLLRLKPTHVSAASSACSWAIPPWS
jgi:hypothetical protein